jgi:hypothetical protein
MNLPILHGKPLQINKLFEGYISMYPSSLSVFDNFVERYKDEFESKPERYDNAYFGNCDGQMYYSFVRDYKPERIIEIGSGFCTKIALDAIYLNGFGRITSIDPHPRTDLDPKVKRITSKVEDVDISIFKELKCNDILFIDSSHSKEEAEYNTKNILDNLNLGVLIHFHDITFPYENSPEGDVVLKYLSENKDRFDILLGSAHIRYRKIDSVDSDVSYLYKTVNAAGSLWIFKKGE